MVKSTSPRMLQREWSTYYSTCSLMGGSEARCCWVHIIPLAYSRNPRDAQAKICRKRPDKMKLSETLVAYLVEQLGARAPPTCHDQLGCTINRRSPWPHQPGTPSRVSSLDPLRPALAVVPLRSNFSNPESPTAENTPPSLRPRRRGTSTDRCRQISVYPTVRTQLLACFLEADVFARIPGSTTTAAQSCSSSLDTKSENPTTACSCCSNSMPIFWFCFLGPVASSRRYKTCPHGHGVCDPSLSPFIS